MALTEINEQLTDECIVKDGELQSLNESLVQTQQNFAEYKEALMRKEQEVGAMTTELTDLVDSEGNVRPNVKESIINEFSESPAGSNWFYSLTMPMVSYALTELVDAIGNDNPGVTMLSVIDIYYNKEAKCPPWEVSKEIKVDRSTMGLCGESADGDSEESASSFVGSQGVPSKYMTEASMWREGDQSLFFYYDDVAVLNLEEPDAERNEGISGDKSRLNLPNAPSMTAHGSGNCTISLGPRVSGSAQVPDAEVSTGVGIIRPLKTFGVVLGLGQKSERVIRFDVAASLYDVQEDPTWI